MLFIHCEGINILWILLIAGLHNYPSQAEEGLLSNETSDSTSFVTSNFTLPVPSLPTVPPLSCRYWAGYEKRHIYNLITCGSCYGYQFPKLELKPYQTSLVSVNGTIFPHLTIITPDIQNKTAVEKICSTLPSEASCGQWLQCCTAAEECCTSQNAPKYSRKGSHAGDCPSTWDGYDCWSEAPSGYTVAQSCPGYIPSAMPARDAYKTCHENGTWFKLTGKEWTNYTTCLNFDSIKVVIFVKIGGNLLSLVVLIPSLCIFLSYRALRNQNRVRLHINLFSSFILYGLINTLWEIFVVYERMHNSSGDTVMNSNSVGCKLLYVLTRYSSTSTFIWMFCEGLYLHRLIVKAFQPPKKLFLFYILGWGFPLVPTVVYSIIRIFKKNENCWVHQIGGYEWIFYVPNMLALLVNLAFLIDILRILLTQLQSHPNEPSNYRRALKATFVLIPLFGLQLFLVIYRPNMSTSAGHIYEIFSALVVNTQGFFVALIFCLINGEVLSNIKRTCMRHGMCIRENHANHTQYTVTSDVYTRESPPTSSFRVADCPNGGSKSKNYIAMKPMGNNNGNAY